MWDVLSCFMLPSEKKVGESWVRVVCELFGERERKKVGEGRGVERNRVKKMLRFEKMKLDWLNCFEHSWTCIKSGASLCEDQRFCWSGWPLQQCNSNVLEALHDDNSVQIICLFIPVSIAATLFVVTAMKVGSNGRLYCVKAQTFSGGYKDRWDHS